MASCIKVIQTDLTDKKKRLLLTNIVKHAYSYVTGLEEFKGAKDPVVQARQQEFKEQFVGFIHNQMIKEGSLHHYVVLLGTQFMLQVKYKKGSMIKFDVYGQTVLLYEVAYIDVPTLQDTSRVRNSEIKEIEEAEVDVEER
jgi:hypothetical protein